MLPHVGAHLLPLAFAASTAVRPAISGAAAHAKSFTGSYSDRSAVPKPVAPWDHTTLKRHANTSVRDEHLWMHKKIIPVGFAAAAEVQSLRAPAAPKPRQAASTAMKKE